METIQNAPSCIRQVKVNVKGTSESPTKINLRSGKFKLVIDEPEAMGGHQRRTVTRASFADGISRMFKCNRTLYRP